MLLLLCLLLLLLHALLFFCGNAGIAVDCVDVGFIGVAVVVVILRVVAVHDFADTCRVVVIRAIVV